MHPIALIAAVSTIILGIGLAGNYYSAQTDVPTDDEVRRVQQLLPHGCVLFNIGKFGAIKNLVVIECMEQCTTIRQTPEEATILLKPIF